MLGLSVAASTELSISQHRHAKMRFIGSGRSGPRKVELRFRNVINHHLAHEAQSLSEVMIDRPIAKVQKHAGRLVRLNPASFQPSGKILLWR